MKDYNSKFNKEIERILNIVYHNPMPLGANGIKRIVIQTEKRYIDYLVELELIKDLSTSSGNNGFGIQLERKGYEVFEKYKGWDEYRIKVIDKANQIEKAKGLAARFWWLPIIISFIALTISIVSFFIKK